MNIDEMSLEELREELKIKDREIALLKKKGESATPHPPKTDGPQEQFYSLAEHSPNIIFINSKGRVVYVNQKGVDITGYSREEIYAENFDFLKLIGPDSIDSVKNNFSRHMKGEDVSPYECTVLTRDGQPIDTILSTSLFQFSTERAILGVLTDISARKTMERQLKESETKYRHLVENALVGVYQATFDGDILYANPAVFKIFEVEPPRTLLKREHLYTYQNPEDRETLIALLKENGAVSEYELHVSTVAGKPKVLLFNAVLEKSIVSGMISDITLQKLAIQQLQESEEKFRNLADDSPNMIYIATLDGKVVYVNRRSEEILGYSRESFYANDFDFLTLIAPEYREVVLANLQKRRDGIDVSPYEYTLITREGKRVDAIVTSRSITYEGQRALLGIVTDISYQKKTELEMRKIDKLHSIGQLAGGIAHDFNNLLTGIMGNISLAQSMVISPNKCTQVLDRAANACRRAQKLTQQLITFSQGGSPLKKAASIVELVKESAAFILSGSNVKCIYQIQDALRPVDIDQDQMNQAINALILNADQAMPDGGILTIRAENLNLEPDSPLPLLAGEYVKVSIHDQGFGITPQNLPKIFDPYFSTKTENSGLGLSTAYSIIRKHNGYIDVESDLGKGTTFFIYFPVSVEKTSPADGQTENGSAPKPNRRILIMDDEEIVLEVLSDLLEILGFEVAVSKEGKEALRKYKDAADAGKPFLAVIMDLTIPGGMGGRETIIKLLQIDSKAKAIVSSGYSHDPIMANYRRYGFCGMIPKPYELKELKLLMAQLVAQ